MARRLAGWCLSMGVALIVCAQTSNATPPGFDCSAAHAALALVICSNGTLSTLDLSFADAYQALRQTVGPQGATEVFQEAVSFQSTVNSACNLPEDTTGFDPSLYTDCIQQLYLKQRAAWVTRLAGPALEETSLAPEQLLAAQTQLENQGFLPAGSKIDGVYGPSTRAGIIGFQQAKGLALTAFLDHPTFNFLMGAASGAVQLPSSSAPPPTNGLSEAAQLAIAKLQAVKAQADAAKAEAEAAKAQADAAAQAAAQQKAAIEAKALQDAQGTSP